MFRLDRQRQTPVAHGDNRLLQVLLVGGAFDHCVQLLAHALVGQADLAAQAHELGGGVIRNLVLGKDTTPDLLLDGTV